MYRATYIGRQKMSLGLTSKSIGFEKYLLTFFDWFNPTKITPKIEG